MLVVTAVPRLAEDMQDQADQPLVDSEDKVGAVHTSAVIVSLVWSRYSALSDSGPLHIKEVFSFNTDIYNVEK